ncbi:phospho-N-acetylmuramoyl-pentapeptide-transferase homolog [Elaeis guineensis]|uniref:Phospho-N-acetylmuramoyl-pentapeptide- transferase homolog n=1 Tax=Elaeis guineensis var. tenera TaxID=51953 RepID=A0A6I9R3F0_ELAGV|nr:phospho-N-acetylmuramoyl-pentapeptide-transferase homolog [Elaeis guineensis]
MSSAIPHFVRLGFEKPRRFFSSPTATRSLISSPVFRFGPPRSGGFKFGLGRCSLKRFSVPMATFDENSLVVSTVIEESNGICGGMSSSMPSPSDGEDRDTELLVYPSVDVDLPINKDRVEAPDPSLAVTGHHVATLQQGRKRRRIQTGILINMGLIAFSAVFLLFFDWCSWRIIRQPLKPFLLMHPFTLSAFLSAFAGYLYVPIVDGMKIHQILRKEGPTTHSSKRGTPTMGGLFFIPIGVFVARVIAGGNSIQLDGAAVATFAFAIIGLLDDLLSCIKSHNYGLPGWVKLSLQVAVGTWFSFWLDSSSISTPYNMKWLVPLPPPFGLVCLGKFYLILTAFCFAAMGNGVNLTDGLDGLAGGSAALAFVAMSVTVLAICPELAVFGASMAGACIGFLFHNGYKASIFMGDTGSLALGGALAAMAACTGMFFPLFIASGIFVMEVLSVIIQVLSVKITKRLYGTSRRVFRMAPVHHHFELCGLKEPIIVASAYVISYILAMLAGYIGLISA